MASCLVQNSEGGEHSTPSQRRSPKLRARRAGSGSLTDKCPRVGTGSITDECPRVGTGSLTDKCPSVGTGSLTHKCPHVGTSVPNRQVSLWPKSRPSLSGERTTETGDGACDEASATPHALDWVAGHSEGPRRAVPHSRFCPSVPGPRGCSRLLAWEHLRAAPVSAAGGEASQLFRKASEPCLCSPSIRAGHRPLF